MYVNSNISLLADLPNEGWKTEDIFFENAGRMRDVLIEDDKLYAITNNLDGRGTPDGKDDKSIEIPL
ncbi:hypothetical protein [Virgibacillus pantothenticus]|uniref:hypothetical protein n=1 Tax=Virgibacillus pantothenticus TaxID=1473 RepID=UPI00098763E1|nr:hypothetical protein [Virgibacillus pantothenticus]